MGAFVTASFCTHHDVEAAGSDIVKVEPLFLRDFTSMAP